MLSGMVPKKSGFGHCYVRIQVSSRTSCVWAGNKPLTAAGLIDLLVVDCHGESGSNERLQSEEATKFLECFIIDCEDGKVTYNNASDGPQESCASVCQHSEE